MATRLNNFDYGKVLIILNNVRTISPEVRKNYQVDIAQ
jgi:hypothetical protein